MAEPTFQLTERRGRAAAHIVVGHDVPRFRQASSLLESLATTPVTHKIGLRAILGGYHLELLERASRLKVQVMLDAKLYDVNQTCDDAVGNPDTLTLDPPDLELEGLFHYSSLWGVTVSAFAGPKTLEGLVKRFDGTQAKPIAVGYLTSISPQHFARMGSRFPTITEAQVHILGQAYGCGVRRFVCSGQELEALLTALPADAEFIVPGVRLPTETAREQERIVQPGFAVALAPTRVKVVIASGIAGFIDREPGPLGRAAIYADHIADALDAAA